MFPTQKQKSLLKKNLKTEFDSVMFYIENLDKLNYKGNKKSLDTLVLGSLHHAGLITKQILAIGGQGRFDKTVKKRALREEQAMREIYAFELKKADRPSLRKVFKSLIKEEIKHVRLVQDLK